MRAVSQGGHNVCRAPFDSADRFAYAVIVATLVLTVIGDDSAGLVNAVAELIALHGGNWERSQMAELAGKFAGIVLVTVPDDRSTELIAGLEPLEGMLDVTAQLATVGAPDPSTTASRSIWSAPIVPA